MNPAPVLMQRESLFTMKNEFCTLADASRDFIYNKISSSTRADATIDLIYD
jgi:hypothetical protein